VALEVVAADLDADRHAIVACLARHLTERPEDTRFDWLYREGPHGTARAWLARETTTGEIVGVAAAFPRRLRIRGVSYTALILGDFCIAEAYRSLGPALRLQRACLGPIDAGEAAFCYDFPSAGMVGVYHRLGIKPHGQVVRWARPLRIDPAVRRLVRDERLAATVSRVANAVLALRQAKGGTRGIRVDVEHGSWQAMADVAGKAVTGYDIFTERSEGYLRWRYERNPTCRYTVLGARHDGGMTGYAVLAEGQAHVLVAELIAPDEAARQALLVGAAGWAGRNGAVTLSLPLLEGDPLAALARRTGFRPRESRPLMVYAGVAPHIDVAGHRWLLTHGDRDS
jgi:hypothetical protein